MSEGFEKGFEIVFDEAGIDFVLFETERLFVREYNIDDFDAVKAYASDAEVTAYLPWGPADDDTVQRIVASRLKSQIEEARTRFEFIVCLKASGEAIGAVGLHLSDDLKQGDLGFIFNRRFWGSGYASETAQGMLRFGFMNLDLHRITAKCDSENLASEAVMKRIGMRKEGETKKSVYTKVRGKEQWRSEKLYAMLQKEFLNALIEFGEL